MKPALVALLGIAMSLGAYGAPMDAAKTPLYKPSSRSPQPLDILDNRYGASVSAPNALEIGDKVPDFRIPRAGGGEVALQTLRASGEVVILFYRGHW